MGSGVEFPLYTVNFKDKPKEIFSSSYPFTLRMNLHFYNTIF